MTVSHTSIQMIPKPKESRTDIFRSHNYLFTLYIQQRIDMFRSGLTDHFQVGRALRISRQAGYKFGKFVSPKHQPVLPLDTHWYFLVLRPCRSKEHSVAERIERVKKKPPSGIEPAPFLLLAQCLKQLRHPISTYAN